MSTNLTAKLMSETEVFLSEVEAFLAETGMKKSYFGKLASGNSELVKRIREGKRVWPETIDKARAFMCEYRRTKKSESAA
ncbi:hypothetical protein LPB79_13065 [Rhizobium sp. T136]|uniref:hypothetical protein n=1 Tax=Rhizobium sp. T136 TaxID=555319 RepID=UPI001E62BAFE|nr:hypothetical protein [Rhizobium sp. T136]UFS83177.1 hypothetical protein LPB79_13065 [Rhizobium sp. T136]